MNLGDKLLCKKTIRRYDQLKMGKFQSFFTWMMGWNRKTYTKGVSYEISDISINYHDKSILWVRIKTNTKNIIDRAAFQIDSDLLETVYNLDDYFYTTNKEIRKLKLEKLNSV